MFLQAPEIHLKEVTLVKSSYLSLLVSDWNYVKIGRYFIDCNFLSINFKVEGGNSDMWHVIQLRSIEPVHNYVTVGDWHNIFLKNPNQFRHMAF